jgi:ATP-dependent Clp protease ATP-binding subunit ClpB
LVNQQKSSFYKFHQIFLKPQSKPLIATSAIGLAGVGLALCSNNITDNQYFLKAVKAGNYSRVAAAIKSGADPNSRHHLGWSALHVAAVNGHREIVELLLKSGADPNLPDEYTNIYHTARDKGMHSLDVMVMREDEFSSSLNMRANFRGCTPLHYAVLADDPAVVSLLLEAGADPLRANDYGRTPVKTLTSFWGGGGVGARQLPL